MPRAAGKRDIVEIIPTLRTFATGICDNPEDADDLVRAALLKALANVDQFDAETDLKLVLLSILQHAAAPASKPH